MNIYQYNALRCPEEEPRVIKLSEMIDQTPRTLAYGFTSNRDTWHLYLNRRKQFVLIIYSSKYLEDSEEEASASYDEELPVNEIFNELPHDVQPKRLYPESCDYEVMKLLQYMGVTLPFTTFDERRYDKVKDLVYHGELDVYDREGV